MKTYDAASIRNICLLGHVGVGKTTLLEAMSFTCKATHKTGKVDDGSSNFDTRQDERDRKMSISMAVGICEWRDTKINVLDTPGFLDFVGEAQAAAQVVESAMIVVDAVDGVQVGTEVTARFVEAKKVPKFFFVNGLNRENVDFDKTLRDIKGVFGTSVAPLQIPMGTGSDLRGIVDIVAGEAYEYADGSNGFGKKVAIPGDMADAVKGAREALMESIAESDEELMNVYFENGELTDEQMRRGLARGVSSGMIYPLLCGCAAQSVGTDRLLDAVVGLCPSAADRTEVEVVEGGEKKMVPCGADQSTGAFVFKTISEEHVGELNIVRVFSGSLRSGQEYANTARNGTERPGSVYFVRGKEKIDASEIPAGDFGGMLKLKDTHTNDSLVEKGTGYRFAPIEFGEPLVSTAIQTKSKGDEDKIGTGLAKLGEEDVTFSYKFHPDIRQSILSGMGDMHVEVILDALKKRFKVEVERFTPKISYRETITKPVKYVEYTHKKQTGGAGQFARVFIDLEPMERGAGYEFVDKIVGGVIDQPLRPSVDKGIRAKLKEGIVAGYPIVDVRVYLVDGKTHPVDSKDVAFQIAGREVFKKAFEAAGPILLEPIVELRVTVPEEYTGDVMGDLSSRRGRIGGMEPNGRYQTVNAKVPAAEILNYSQALRSLSQGRGLYSRTFSHYDPVPGDVAKKVIEQSAKEQEAS